MLHLGFRRNANELYGAYGHNLTFGEMEWLANWCFVRGQNFLIPHAFYYSVRGPRLDERPPDVGPNAAWWDKYKPYADACSRLSWLNTDSKQVSEIAILSEATWLPDRVAKICYQNQRDFNYLEIRHLWEDAKVDKEGINIAGMLYRTLIIDSLSFIPEQVKPALKILAGNGKLIVWKDSKYSTDFIGAKIVSSQAELVAAIDKLVKPDLILTPASSNIRYRHVVKGGDHYFILFNEDNTEVSTRLSVPVKGKYKWIDPQTAQYSDFQAETITVFKAHELKILYIK